MGASARRAVGAAGVVVTVVGAVVVVSPSVATGTPLSSLTGVVSTLDARLVMIGGGLLVTLSLLGSALAPSDERRLDDDGASERFDSLVGRPPETVVDEAPRTAGAFDATVERAVAGDEAALDRVQERLGALVVATLDGRVDDPTAVTGDRRIAAGAWTDDRTAAAFLAGPDGPSETLSGRIRQWLDSERERRRRIGRTVEAIDDLTDGGPGRHRNGGGG